MTLFHFFGFRFSYPREVIFLSTAVVGACPVTTDLQCGEELHRRTATTANKHNTWTHTLTHLLAYIYITGHTQLLHHMGDGITPSLG